MGTCSWGVRLSQIARVTGSIYIVTGRLLSPDHVSRILGKRPPKISIIATASARREASVIKRSFPDVRVAQHSDCDAKVVLVEPDTVWVSSADCGRSAMIESTVGPHSTSVFNRALESFSPQALVPVARDPVTLFRRPPSPLTARSPETFFLSGGSALSRALRIVLRPSRAT